MPLLREKQVFEAARRAEIKRPNLTARRILEEQAVQRRHQYDVFLSHSIKDARLVLGVKQILEESDLTVYVDWVEDPQLDRGNVNRITAELLRGRMTCCSSLLYLHTRHSGSSKWMPWELGYFDGHNGNVAILPVIGDNDPETFQSQEYLGLYPYVDFLTLPTVNRRAPRVKKPGSGHLLFDPWKRGDRNWRVVL